MGNRLTGLARLGEEVSRSLEEARTAAGGASRVRAKLVAVASQTRKPATPAPVMRRFRTGRIASVPTEAHSDSIRLYIQCSNPDMVLLTARFQARRLRMAPAAVGCKPC